MSAITQYGYEILKYLNSVLKIFRMVDPTTEGCSEYQAVCTRNGAICNPIRLKV